MLTEKVETRAEFIAAKKAGFLYFQGYFFRRPEVLTSHEIPANQLNYLGMLTAVSQRELDVRVIENLVKSEAALCYRLLRYLNSAAFGLSAEIRSVQHALAILGEREVRRWIRLVATLGAGQGKTTDLVLAALVRARFCELLSPKIAHGDSDLFLMGLLSLMDTMLEVPMHQVLILAQEAGEWKTVSELTRQLHLNESDVATIYWQAMQWAREVTAGT